jgi:hypothetical protein
VKSKRVVLTLLAAAAIIAVLLAVRHFRTAASRTDLAGKANAPVEIRDGKTIDFSSGKPVVKDSSQEKAIIDAAVKEMEDATRNVSFAPTPAPAPPDQTKKSAGPAAAPANP